MVLTRAQRAAAAGASAAARRRAPKNKSPQRPARGAQAEEVERVAPAADRQPPPPKKGEAGRKQPAARARAPLRTPRARGSADEGAKDAAVQKVKAQRRKANLEGQLQEDENGASQSGGPERRDDEADGGVASPSSNFWSMFSSGVPSKVAASSDVAKLNMNPPSSPRWDSSLSTRATLGGSSWRGSPSASFGLGEARSRGRDSRGADDSPSAGDDAAARTLRPRLLASSSSSLLPQAQGAGLPGAALSSACLSSWRRTASLFSTSFFSASLFSASRFPSSAAAAIARIQFQQLLVTFLCYASLYLTRKPFASARALLQHELGVTTADMGYIDTAFLLMYAITQLFLAAPAAARFADALKLFFVLVYSLSSFSCLFVALAPLPLLRLPLLLGLWALNGATQALVFPFTVSILRQWLNRLPGGGGGVFGLWSTCQQVGSMGASYLTAEILSSLSSSPLLYLLPEPRAAWRLTFLIPAVFVFLAGLLLSGCLVEQPAALIAQLEREEQNRALAAEESSPLPRASSGETARPSTGVCEAAKPAVRSRGVISRSTPRGGSASAGQLLWRAAKVPGVGESAAAYFCMKLVRYLLINWLPLFLQAHLLLSPMQATLGAILFEAGGVAGAVLVGFLSDRLFAGRRFVVVAPLCVLAAGCAWLLSCGDGSDAKAEALGELSLRLRGLLFLLGACVAGPDSVLGGMGAAEICAEALATRPQKTQRRADTPKDARGEEEEENRDEAVDTSAETDTASKAAGETEQGTQQLIATASCFVNGSGSVGSILQGTLTPLIISLYGWHGVVLALSSFCGGAAVALLPLLARDISKARNRPQELL
ncbi:transporter, major facilitator family protein [Besnoitia besnoiti]|uniref:Transporter, major facilitator family protein n=1 Tax=Besnoitia besnoiti TaxID=94643 RepID=A0A2A9MBV5_BESBE|nr:transporter, major facilitator family protein [Besnoitia besnoiti]PFH33153.1 transporter, major facilitator family protein [Besnoitia besnoiti]